jgi:DNA-binding CsgD family transcriptional regulator
MTIMEQQQIHYTPRELQVIKLILMNINRKRMEGVLGIAKDTLKTHFKSIHLKTNEHSNSGLILFLITHDFSVNAERTIVTYMGRQL